MVRRWILAVLTLLLFLAAALMTALFIFRHRTPDAFQQASAGPPAQLLCDESASLDTMLDMCCEMDCQLEALVG